MKENMIKTLANYDESCGEYDALVVFRLHGSTLEFPESWDGQELVGDPTVVVYYFNVDEEEHSFELGQGDGNSVEAEDEEGITALGVFLSWGEMCAAMLDDLAAKGIADPDGQLQAICATITAARSSVYA